MLRFCAAVLTAVSALAALDQGEQPQGMEILPLIKAAGEVVSPREAPLPGRAWSNDLAAITDPDPSVHSPAIGRLVRRGAIVLPDLTIMSSDRDWQLRARIARIAAGIGGTDGAPLALVLSKDNDPRVRRLSIVALGHCRGDEVLARLLELSVSLDGDERAMAAPSLAAQRDFRAIEPLTRHRADPDAPARKAQAQALRELCFEPSAVGTIAPLLGKLQGEQRRALLEALDGIADTRLCPALAMLVDEHEAITVLLSVRALATAGDARAVEPLVRLASSERLPDLRTAAATTLRILTGYPSGPGQAWALWWKDNAVRWQRLGERDGLIAELLDERAPIPPGLATFTPAELTPLVDAVLVTRRVPRWLPKRALAALRTQSGERWIQPLAVMIDNAPDSESRMDLILLLDEIGGVAATGELRRQVEELEARERLAMETWEKKGVIPASTAAERALLELALARR